MSAATVLPGVCLPGVTFVILPGAAVVEVTPDCPCVLTVVSIIVAVLPSMGIVLVDISWIGGTSVTEAVGSTTEKH